MQVCVVLCHHCGWLISRCCLHCVKQSALLRWQTACLEVNVAQERTPQCCDHNWNLGVREKVIVNFCLQFWCQRWVSDRRRSSSVNCLINQPFIAKTRCEAKTVFLRFLFPSDLFQKRDVDKINERSTGSRVCVSQLKILRYESVTSTCFHC